MKAINILSFIKHNPASLVLFLLLGNLCFGQDNKVVVADSLIDLDYEELESKYELTRIKDITLAKLYARTFLNRAKKEKNVIKQADGYYMLAKTNSDTVSIIYSDTVIDLTEKIKDYKYPAEVYLYRAKYFGANGYYQSSMDELVKANEYAEINKNTEQLYSAKYFIALLKDNLGEFQETLDLYKSIEKYREERYLEDKNYKDKYLMSIFALGVSYLNNKLYDSAYFVKKKGIKLSLEDKDSLLYDRFLLASGSSQYYKAGYTSSLDSLLKFKKLYENRKSLINLLNFTAADSHLGLIYHEKGKIEESIKYFKKVDSITFATKNFFPSFREIYQILISHFKEKDNKEQQLYYVNRLLAFDSVVEKDTRYLYNKINKEYDTPKLLSEKEKIISSLKASKGRSNDWILVLIAVIGIAVGVAVFNYRKRNVYQKRFEDLVDQQSKEDINEESSNSEESKEIGISEEVVAEILSKLRIMEDKNRFLASNVTITSLSKQLKTNPNYLSKIINTYKNKRFNQYINDLRIDYVVKQLQSDSKFRKYTVKAIAQEIGFNSQDAFSKAFYKNTGLRPSYFIKQLEKKEG